MNAVYEDTRRKVAAVREAQLARLADENARMRATLEVIAGNGCRSLEYARGIAQETLDGGRWETFRINRDVPEEERS